MYGPPYEIYQSNAIVSCNQIILLLMTYTCSTGRRVSSVDVYGPSMVYQVLIVYNTAGVVILSTAAMLEIQWKGRRGYRC